MDPSTREIVDRRPDFYVAYCQNCEDDRIISNDMDLASDRPTTEVGHCPDCKLNTIREIFHRALDGGE